MSLVVQALVCLLMGVNLVMAQDLDAVKRSSDQTSRVVVVGDVHGDYKQFVTLLRNSSVIDDRGNWIAGDNALVQMGDLTDRGPESLKAIHLLQKLQVQAQEKGGVVEVLIGNHEAMNMIGDLRYVHPGEYRALRDSQSKQRRRNYYARVKEAQADAAAKQGKRIKFDRNHRRTFEKQFPLGYVEHRLAWAPSGELGEWTLRQDVVLKLGDSLFVHGGLSPKYASQSISEINTRVRSDLIDPKVLERESSLEDPDGPLWYRGWAALAETPENEAQIDRILRRFEVQRMIIAHTPLVPTVLPRFNGKLLMVDVGLAEHYGGGNGVLELINERAYVRHGNHLIAVPTAGGETLNYLQAVSEVAVGKQRILRYRDLLLEAVDDTSEEQQPAASR